MECCSSLDERPLTSEGLTVALLDDWSLPSSSGCEDRFELQGLGQKVEVSYTPLIYTLFRCTTRQLTGND